MFINIEYNLNLIKTSFLTFISTAIKIIAGLIINKAVSIYIGPSGIALIGQFQNTSQVALTLAQGGVNKGVTKYTAEYSSDTTKQAELWSTSLKIVTFCSVVVGLALIVFCKYLSEYTLNTEKYTYVFVVFGFTVIFFSINQLLLSILNGLKEIRTFISINITQSIYSLIFTTALVIAWGLDGALIALVSNQSVVFITVLWRLRKHKLIVMNNFLTKFNKTESRKLLSYSLMALTSVCTVPISLMFVRNYLGEHLSWDAAGYWQSMWYISSVYLMVITTALSTYYLPRLSEITTKIELREELKQGYKIIIPIVIVLSLSIYLLREFIVWLLFSEEFKPMLHLFKWQLIGDVIKISSWLIAYIMLAKAMVKSFIITEMVFALSFVLFAVYFVDGFGLIGMTYAYTLNYIIYFFTILFVIKGKIFD